MPGLRPALGTRRTGTYFPSVSNIHHASRNATLTRFLLDTSGERDDCWYTHSSRTRARHSGLPLHSGPLPNPSSVGDAESRSEDRSLCRLGSLEVIKIGP